MRTLTPTDIASYIYCPILYYRQRQDFLYPDMSLFEDSLKKSFIKAEEKSLFKDTIVSVHKLTRAWDSIWWPSILKNKIDKTTAEKTTVKAVGKFMDYCNYEITDYLWPTVGVDVISKINLGDNILEASSDVIKINLEKNKRNTVLLNFTNKSLSIRDAAFDNRIKATAYAFWANKGETITHFNVNINEKQKDVDINVSTFQDKDLREIEKMVKHVSSCIYTGVRYMNPHMCERCNICPQLKS